ncbi:MAG: T9SS type A sorting domain-containing protein [Myroides sp.]|nr:T9SS type A sorting domain-containing protein [Myroides sp.]
MKKKLFITAVLLLQTYFLSAQVLYTENFNNYNLGNLGTDFTGTIPAQGGWITDFLHFPNQSLPGNNHATVITDVSKVKALKLSNGDPWERFTDAKIYQPNINTLIDQRIAGNNVIAVEFDLFTGPKIIVNSQGNYNFIRFFINSNSMGNNVVSFQFHTDTGVTQPSSYQVGQLTILHSTKPDWRFLSHNTWYTIKMYVDFDAKKVYHVMPYCTTVFDFLRFETGSNLIEKYKPTSLGFDFYSSFFIPQTNVLIEETYVKIDNIKISALQSVPPEVLGTDNFLAQKFNIYPNPATNIVNITNGENLLVNKVTIYDIAGKQLSTQTFNNEAEIQLNVENLASGTYMLHLQTNEGTAVKKLVKK